MLAKQILTKRFAVFGCAPRSFNHRTFSNSSFEDKEKAEENRYFRQQEARLLEKLKQTVTATNKETEASPSYENLLEIKLREVFAANGVPADSKLFRDLLRAFAP